MTQSTEELERLIKAGTPGPWEVCEGTKDWRPQIVSTEHGPICTACFPDEGEPEANAALICAAVNALPELVAKVKRLEADLQVIAFGWRYVAEPDNSLTKSDWTRDQLIEYARAALQETKA